MRSPGFTATASLRAPNGKHPVRASAAGASNAVSAQFQRASRIAYYPSPGLSVCDKCLFYCYHSSAFDSDMCTSLCMKYCG